MEVRSVDDTVCLVLVTEDFPVDVISQVVLVGNIFGSDDDDKIGRVTESAFEDEEGIDVDVETITLMVDEKGDLVRDSERREEMLDNESILERRREDNKSSDEVLLEDVKKEVKDVLTEVVGIDGKENVPDSSVTLIDGSDEVLTGFTFRLPDTGSTPLSVT